MPGARLGADDVTMASPGKRAELCYIQEGFPFLPRVSHQHITTIFQSFISALSLVVRWGWGSLWSLICFLFFFLAAPCGLRDLSSPTRDQTHAPYSGSTES